MNPSVISVVIPTHNRPRSLQNAVASVRAQTNPPREIVVVDDGSRPPVDSKLFDGSTIPIRVVRNVEARGPAAARNVGVNHASGDLVAFLDDDDTWVPRKLEFVAACFARHPDTDVATHRTGYQPSARVDNQPWVVLEDPLTRMLHKQPPHLDGVVVRRTVHLDSPLDESFAGAEDLDYLIRLAKAGARMVESTAVLAILGDAETSAIGIDKRIRGRLQLLARHPEILTDRRARAFFYLRLGHQYRRNGQRLDALGSFGRSLAARPNVSATKGILLSLLTEGMQKRLVR